MSKQKNSHPKKTAKPRQDDNFREAASLTCACNRDITIAELGKIYTSRTQKQLDEFLAPLNKTFTDYGLDTCLKKAHFLAQVGHESAQTKYLEELGISEESEKQRYGGYKGRGLIQLTFKDAYEKYGEYLDKDFLGEKRTQIATPLYGTDSAGWFWKKYKGVDLGDSANINDFIYITQKINGAFNGWDDRLAHLSRSTKSLMVDFCPNLKSCLNFSDFALATSKSNESKFAAFAWGYWFDPDKKFSGVTSSKRKSLEGYSRFLELTTELTDREENQHGCFGFKTIKTMKGHAIKRVALIK